MADEIRGKLTSLPGVQVIARGSSTPYKKTTKTPKQIAEELNARYLLTATVRWEKGGGTSRVHVSPELVDVTRSGAPTSKWQQPFDAAMTDVFQVQSDIATQVAQALGGALGAGEEKRLSERPTQNLAAYDAFLKGEQAVEGMAMNDPPSLRKALASTSSRWLWTRGLRRAGHACRKRARCSTRTALHRRRLPNAPGRRQRRRWLSRRRTWSPTGQWEATSGSFFGTSAGRERSTRREAAWRPGMRT